MGIPEGVGSCQRVCAGRGFRLSGRERGGLIVGVDGWVVEFRTRFRRSAWAGSAAGHSFADRWQRGALRPRPDGLKQLVDRAASCRGHADYEHASGRVRAVSRSVGQAADLAVAQAVVDEGQDFAGDGHGGFVLAAPLRDLAVVGGEFPAPW
jgi:hypothetical protein